MSNYQSFRKSVDQELSARKIRALESVGLFLVGEAQAICPYDTRNLLNSITHEIGDDYVRMGTPVEYAEAVEVGIKQRAQPYLRPAVENNIADIRAIVSRELGK